MTNVPNWEMASTKGVFLNAVREAFSFTSIRHGLPLAGMPTRSIQRISVNKAFLQLARRQTLRSD
jgi:hypothetical protein